MVEAKRAQEIAPCNPFQSAGRIIGWLKAQDIAEMLIARKVSIRRADYWLVEADERPYGRPRRVGFNPPGGLLVG